MVDIITCAVVGHWGDLNHDLMWHVGLDGGHNHVCSSRLGLLSVKRCEFGEGSKFAVFYMT